MEDKAGQMAVVLCPGMVLKEEVKIAQEERKQDTLRPVTIKQLIDATAIPHSDAEFKIDGVEVNQVTFIGQIQTITPLATNTTFRLDDGTGLIDVKQWIDSDQDPETAKPLPKEGQYVRVLGPLKMFNEKRSVAAHIMRPVTDFNEINMHLLEATAVHLFFTRGPPYTLKGAKTEDSGEGMFVGGYGGAPAGGDSAANRLPRNTSTAARRVFTLLQAAPQNNEGLHVHNIAAQLSMPPNEVFKAGDELLGNGLIYTTVDDETWAVLEY
ncbi:hypothetical protein F5884DRAFT_858618 [Xylogone sp. PMI_703]|nr:hypothetical protein F5884DRAFT_858618 [Xylogone sp. PMI_703]